MIKRLILGIAVLITILGLILKWNTNTLLHVDVILILFVLAIAVAPYSVGCYNVGRTPMMLLLIIILIVFFDLMYGFTEQSYSICKATITDINGTFISNTTIVCP